MTEVTEHSGDGRQRGFRPYPEYTDSGVEWLGEIPAHWQSLALGHLTISRCDGPFGSGLKSEHYTESGVRVVRLHNIGWAEFTDLDAAYLDDAYARRLGDHSVKGGDVLIAGLGEDGHPVGRACVAPVEIEPAMVKADCFRFRLARERILPRYAAFQLSATAAAVAGRYATGATRTRMNLATSASRKITLPPMKEQEAIAAFLDRETEKIDALVTRKERLIELLQEKRAALITRAVTRGLDPNVPMKDSGVEWLGEIPAHWEVKKLSYLTNIGNGSTPNRNELRYWVDGSHPWLTSAKINERIIATADQFVTDVALRECHLPRVPAGSILIAITEEGQTRGRVALLSIDSTISQHLAYVTPGCPEVNAGFLVRLFEASYEWLRDESSGSGSTRAALTCEFLGSVRLAFPTEAEQRAIAAFLDRKTFKIEVLIAEIRQAIGYLNEFRTALISAAVTGKIDVREATPR